MSKSILAPLFQGPKVTSASVYRYRISSELHEIEGIYFCKDLLNVLNLNKESVLLLIIKSEQIANMFNR